MNAEFCLLIYYNYNNILIYYCARKYTSDCPLIMLLSKLISLQVHIINVVSNLMPETSQEIITYDYSIVSDRLMEKPYL
jgi:hypothetical protein